MGIVIYFYCQLSNDDIEAAADSLGSLPPLLHKSESPKERLMKKNAFSLILGLIIILVGIYFGGRVFGFWEWDISFDGWWTLFIIVPGVLSVITSGPHIFNITVVGCGVLMLLNEQQVLQNNMGYKLIAPLIIIAVGVGIIFKRASKSAGDGNNGLFSGNKDGNFFAIFGENSPQFTGISFRGANTYAVFGAISLKLRQAVISRSCDIRAYSIFGGTEICLPENVRATVTCTPVLGGVDNYFVSSTEEKAPMVHIRAICVFGGTTIK